MEERLLAILRLAIKYDSDYLEITQDRTNSETQILINIDGDMRTVKQAAQDDKLIKYISYLCNINLYNRANQTGTTKLIFNNYHVMILARLHQNDNNYKCTLVLSYAH